jgi:amylovoran biosynthesis glycosyltransferase AmsE
MISRKLVSTLLVFSKSDLASKLVRCILALKKDLIAGDQVVLVVNGGSYSSVSKLFEWDDWIQDPLFRMVYLDDLTPFGEALNHGLKHCSHDYILRIDPDDISLPGRIERQMKSLEKDHNLAVCGGWAGEMYDDSGLISVVREPPLDHESIVRQARFKNPMLHVSVIMRKSHVESVGGYPKLSKGQDYLLWIKLIMKGYRFENINSVVVSVDYSDDFSGRRGYQFFKSEAKMFVEIWKCGFISLPILIFNLSSRVILRNSPALFRDFIYKVKLLRGTRSVD